MKGCNGLTHLTILESRACENKSSGKPKLTWMDEIKKWILVETNGYAKK